MITVLAMACSLIASLCFNYGMYLNKVAVTDLPEVNLKLSKGTVEAFLRNKKILIAIGVAVFGAVLYAAALGMAPVSVVQPLVASGVVLLAYLAIKNLGEKPRRIDLVAIGMSLLGVVLIGVSLAQGVPKNVSYNTTLLWIFAASIVFLAIIIPALMMRGSRSTQAAGLGISVGLLYGIGAVFARLLMVDWGNQWHTKGLLVLFASIFLIAWALTYLPGIVVQQAALQRGMAVVVVPILAGLSQLVPIMVGMIALNEKLPTNSALASLRIIAFALILLGTVILSKRAEEAGPAMAEAPLGDKKMVPAVDIGLMVGGTADAEPELTGID